MLPDAPLLILDEPREPRSGRRDSVPPFLATLKERGKIIIFTSHVLSDVEAFADRVAVLVGGRLAAIEPHRRATPKSRTQTKSVTSEVH